MLGRSQGQGMWKAIDSALDHIRYFGDCFLFHIKVVFVWPTCEPHESEISLLPFPSHPHIQSLAA